MNIVSKNHRRIRLAVWVSVTALALVFALRMTVGDVYSVVSASMEPVLRKGDRVFVRYGSGELQRYDLAVFRNSAGQAVVKRLMGLPGDEVLVDQSGDLWINNARPDRPDSWIQVFDDRLRRVADHFQHGNQYYDPWTEGPGYWEVNGLAVKAGSSIGLLRHRDGVKNSELRPDGTFREGSTAVGDLRLQLEVWIPEPGGILVLNLTEESDTFQVRVGLDRLDAGRVFLNHFRGNSGPPVAGSLAPMPQQRWIPVVFENRDNQVRLIIDGKQVLDYEYVSNTFSPVGSIGERVSFGATGTNLRFRSIRIDRDVTYTQRGDRSAPGQLGWGIGHRLTLSSDEFYLLGDRSEVSEDSRSFGPIHRDKIMGRATHRIWPYDRRGSLAGH
ncbi:MAG: signal peptidase I [Planctomycetota bacterium]|nr:signal peptidase I [Planctomycetota bacterium]